ncbi:unnamed protein product [Enterobius vermicularis]|uniref:Bursicon n=1 Tax=Enterobius vermicularis TaxID=51028 RepID=A0A0N4VBS1_ENTVE|nr:unnamed protein product [Enterobius vermicularis]
MIRYVEYVFDNTTIIKQRPPDTFLNLQSESVIEPPLMNPQQKRIKWMERKTKGKKRKKEKKGGKTIPSAKEALSLARYEINLGSVENMKHRNNCKAQQFKQRIRMDGCITKTITNKFCHGTCLSFFIPRLRPRKLKLRSIFHSCSACAPSEYDLVNVKLECPELDTKSVVRQVYKIKKCSCKSVEVDVTMPTDNESLSEMTYK